MERSNPLIKRARQKGKSVAKASVDYATVAIVYYPECYHPTESLPIETAGVDSLRVTEQLVDSATTDRTEVTIPITTKLKAPKPIVFGTLENSGINSTLPKYKLYFLSRDEQRSYVRLTGSTITVTEGEPEQRSLLQLLFGIDCITHMQLISPATISDLPEVARSMPSITHEIGNEHLHVLSLKILPSRVISSRLYMDARYKHGETAMELGIWKSLLYSDIPTDITFLLRGGTVKIEYDTLRRHFSAERQLDPWSKWHSEHKDKYYVNIGQLTQNDDRPKKPVAEVNTFPVFGEYATVVGYGAVQEYEHDDTARTTELHTSMVVANILAAANRQYFAFVNTTSTDNRLRVGDQCLINFDSLDRTLETWTGLVIEPLPLAPVSTTTVLLFRPRREDEGSQIREGSEAVLASGDIDHSSDEAARQSILHLPKVPIRLRIQTSDKTLRKQLDALEKLQFAGSVRAGRYRRLLLGQNTASHFTEDVYRGLPKGEIAHHLQHLSFTSSQKAAVQYLRSLPQGVGVITGPPGTGKTSFIAHVLVPILAPKDRKSVLLVTPSNYPADDLAQTVDRVLKKSNIGLRIVIRMHSFSTEEEVFETHDQRAASLPHPAAIVPGQGDAFKNLAVAQYLKEFYEQATHRPYGVSDPRLRLLDLSLGMWMFKAAGLVPGFPKKAPEDVKTFVELYERLKADDLDDEGMQRFYEEYNKLCQHVIRAADVIVTTCTNSGTEQLHAHFRPDIVVVDEAGRATELDVIVPLYFYHPRCLILVGDDQQLRPTILSDQPATKINCFSPQLAQSLMKRLKDLGFRSATLQEQNRMVAGIVDLPARLFYDGKLHDNPLTTTLADRPKARWFNAFLSEHFGLQPGTVPRIYANLGGTKCFKHGSTYYNFETASFSLDLIIDMIKRGAAPSDIAVITFYQMQCNVYNRALRRMQLRYPQLDLSNVRVRTVDGYQGGESTFVLLDLVITDRIGFLQDNTRINVALTRARDGLVIIGDAKAIQYAYDGKRPERKTLAIIADDFRTTSRIITIDSKSMPRNEYVYKVCSDASVAGIETATGTVEEDVSSLPLNATGSVTHAAETITQPSDVMISGTSGTRQRESTASTANDDGASDNTKNGDDRDHTKGGGVERTATGAASQTGKGDKALKSGIDMETSWGGL
jgi:hypothetical protein